MNKTIDLTNSPLLANLIEIELPDGTWIDLHNNFSCEKIELLDSTLMIRFKASNDYIDNPGGVCIKFSDVLVEKVTIKPLDSSSELCLGTLERIRNEIEGCLVDIDADGKVFFMIDFLYGCLFEIRTRSVALILEE